MSKNRWLIPLFFALLSTQLVAVPAQPAVASSCRNTNRVGAGTTIGSQVDGDLVTICLNKKLLKKLTVKIAPRPVPVSKRPAVRPTVKPIPVARPRPVIKPIPVYKPKPKSKTKISASNRGNDSVFRPRVTQPRVAPVTTKPGQSVTASAAEFTRLGHTVLAGSKVVVRFTPIRLRWGFGDATPAVSDSGYVVDAATSSVKHSYSQAGTYSVQLHVTFRVEYRLQSGQWYRDPDTIELAAAPVPVRVGQQQQKSKENVVLVTP